MSKRSLSIFVFLCLLSCLAGQGLIDPVQVSGLKPPLSGNPSGLNVDFGNIPLYFTANRGQVDGRALFYAKASRYTLWLTEDGLVFDSFKSESPEIPSAGKEAFLPPEKLENRKYERDVSRLIFLNAAKHPEIVPLEETGLKVNYFIGNDPAKWHTAVPTSAAVLYKNIYDHIDLKVYGIESRIEYDWIVRPGGDPRDIRFEYRNVKGARVDEEGNLLVETGFGELMHKRPLAYQEAGGKFPEGDRSGNGTRVAVESAFKKIDKNSYGFEVGAYEAGRELVIDPVVLAYSTYLGGSANDHAYGIAVDDSGYAYVTGRTYGTDFPTLNQYQLSQSTPDAWVAKIDTTQSGNASLVYSTYLGGNREDGGLGIAVDDSGIAYVTGFTNSLTFPTLNQYQIALGGAYYDAFVAKLDTTQSGNGSLVYSTYLGGSSEEEGMGIAVDNSGNAYVTGQTYSTDFPTLNQYRTYPGDGVWNAFVTKIDTTKSGTGSLVYSTYLGGTSSDQGRGIAADDGGNAYVTGVTNSTDFPILNAYQPLAQSITDAFVTKLDTNKSGNASLVYSTYLGGGITDVGRGIAVDNSGNVYVTGQTNSTDFPTLNQYQTHQTGYDAFLTKFDTTQSGIGSLVYSTYLGGNGTDWGLGIAVDNNGNAYVTGYTRSTDFPTLNQYQPKQPGSDIFVTKLNTMQSGPAGLVYSTYLGGSGDEGGFDDYIGFAGIAVDNSGNAYVAGGTASTDFPNLNQYQTNQAGSDAFIAKIRSSADIAVTKTSDNLTPKVGEAFNFTVTATNNGPLGASGLKIIDSLPAALTYQSSTPSKGAYTSGTGIWDIGALAVGETATLTIGVKGTSAGSVANTASVSSLNESDPDMSNNTASATVTVKFGLTIIAGTGGTTNPVPGTYLYDAGAVSVAATASAGYRFGSWSGDASGTTSPVSVTMDGNKTVTAGFVRQYTLTVAAGTGGTTNPVPGTYLYDAGAVSVAATASAGYRFGSWSGDASGTTSPVSVTMDGNKTVTASFIRQYNLTVAAGAGGTTNPVPGTYAYDEGTAVNITSAASANYRFGSWSGDASGTTSPVSVTMNGDKTVTAGFVRQYTLTVAAGTGGTTNPVPGAYTYDEGTAVNITSAASANYRFGSWSGDASGTTSPVSITMNGDKTVTAGFVRQYTLTVAAGTGGTTNPVPGTYTYDEGTAVNITATASVNYRFGSWSGDASGTTSPVNVTMNGDKTVTAGFVRQYTLTVAAGTGGTTNPVPGAYNYDEGAAVSITAAASAGYRFGSWSGDASGTVSPVGVTMNSDKTVSASFVRQYNLTIAAAGSGTTNPGPGTYAYDEGTVVSLTATASADSRFGSWSGDVSGTTSPVSVTMSSDKTVTANFIRLYTLTIAATAGGTTNPVPGTYTYDEGTAVSVTATASASYRFGSWGGDASGSANPINMAMNGNKTLTANFIRQYNLTIAAGAGGTTNPVPGTYAYDEGTAVNVTALPSNSYRFGSWSGDASGTTNPVSVAMNGNKTATASFVRQYTMTIIAPAGGTTSPVPGDHAFDEGTVVSIAATAFAGYRFGSWSLDASGTANPVSVTMNADKDVKANFIRQYTLTIAAGPNGTTTPVPGTYLYDEGAAVSVMATASAGFRFGSWSGDASGSINPVSMTMNSAKTVTANFLPGHTLAITAGAGGTTDPAPGTYAYDDGTAVSIRAVPLAAFQLDYWSGDASGSANPAMVIMNGNKAVQASFTRVVKPPLGLTGEKLANRTVSMVEYVARLRWQPNPANSGIISYRIYRIENGQATVIANVGAGMFEYIVRKLEATGVYRFGVTAVNSQGWESEMVEVTVQ